MTHTPHQTAHDRDIEAFIQGIDPGTMRDATHIRAVSAARAALDQSERQLVESVQAARAAGDSWTMIGIALRTSKQNAHRKFASLIGENSEPKRNVAPEPHPADPPSHLLGVRSPISDERSSLSRDDVKEVNMANNNDRHVVPGKDGGWDIIKPDSNRASSHHNTQAEAIGRGRDIIRNAGGGELNIHGQDGRIRAKDTIPKGNDPRNIRG